MMFHCGDSGQTEVQEQGDVRSADAGRGVCPRRWHAQSPIDGSCVSSYPFFFVCASKAGSWVVLSISEGIASGRCSESEPKRFPTVIHFFLCDVICMQSGCDVFFRNPGVGFGFQGAGLLRDPSHSPDRCHGDDCEQRSRAGARHKTSYV